MASSSEIRSTSGGTPVANFRLATNERRKDSNGEWTDHTEWHTVVVWGRMVNVVEQYVQKGRQLYIEGALRTRDWQTKDGQKRVSIPGRHSWVDLSLDPASRYERMAITVTPCA